MSRALSIRSKWNKIVAHLFSESPRKLSAHVGDRQRHRHLKDAKLPGRMSVVLREKFRNLFMESRATDCHNNDCSICCHSKDTSCIINGIVHSEWEMVLWFGEEECLFLNMCEESSHAGMFVLVMEMGNSSVFIQDNESFFPSDPNYYLYSGTGETIEEGEPGFIDVNGEEFERRKQIALEKHRPLVCDNSDEFFKSFIYNLVRVFPY